MGNSQDKPPLRKALSVPDTHSLPPDAPVLYKEKSRSSQRLYQPNKGGNGKQSKSKIKKSKQQKEQPPEFQLPPSEAAFLPAFPLRGDLEDLDFEVIEVIAKGAYGNVIKVQREDDKRFYASKILSKAQILQEGAVRQCKDEALIQSMAGQHPFVVKAYEYWQSHTNLYLVLEYIPHGDMFTLWTFHGAFPEDLVRLYIAEMSLVLDYLHSECVIYRDIKMENILFDAKGHIQLTDFGLAKWLQSGDNTRTVCGTLQYMAPEVLSVYPYGHPADWWSIGILMFTMLAGRYPVDGMDTHTRMAQKVFECDYLLPSNISDSAQDVINRVLTKSPHKRLCSLYHLQDLHFFEDLIFSDLTDGKINPLDVVPPDFFPMTGASWAPYVFAEEDNKQFEDFDDTNAGYNDGYASDRYDQQDQLSPHGASSMYSHRQAQPDRQLNDFSNPSQPLETMDRNYPNNHMNSYDRSQSEEARANAYPSSQYNRSSEATARAYPQPAERASTSTYSNREQEASASAYPNSQTNNYNRSSEEATGKTYPQPTERASTSAYGNREQEARASAYPNPQTNYNRSSEKATAMAYPQSTERSSTSKYNNKEQTINTSTDSTSVNRGSIYPVENYDGEPRRRDRFGSSSSHSEMRDSEQMLPSSTAYGHNSTNSEPYQAQGNLAYSYSPSHQTRDKPGGDFKEPRFENGQRRGSRDSYIVATSWEHGLHSPMHHSSQPPSLPKNPPPPTLTSQQPFCSPVHSTTRDSSAFKLMEPAPTVTLAPKSINTNTNVKMNNNFMQDAYNINSQVGPRVVPPSSATIVTSPTTKLPPANRMSGYGQLEEAKIELPLSPVVKSPPSQSSQFISPKPNQHVSGPMAPNRFQPPQPPPQSAKPRHDAPPSQFNLQQPPSKFVIPSSTQVVPPQPPPQASKPTVHSKPSVAPKPSVPPKSNPTLTTPKPNNVLAPVPAVRKSFNTKKSHQKYEPNSGVFAKPHSLLTDNNFNSINPSSATANHHYHSSIASNNIDSTEGSFTPQAAPRPVPVPRARPRQAATDKPTDSTPQSQLMASSDRAGYGNDRSSEEQEPQSPGSYQWNLPTSAVPYFV